MTGNPAQPAPATGYLRRVRITDVSPRDGLQNEPAAIPTMGKVRLVELLCDSGVDEVEVTSFVSARWVPQLADAAEVVASLRPRAGRPVLSALVPNEQGLDGVRRANDRARREHAGPVLDKIAVFTAASETFARRNTGASIAETLARFVPVITGARRDGLAVRAYVSCAIACPFEGRIPPGAAVDVAAQLADMGVDDIDLADTIGAGTPASVRALLERVDSRLPGWLGTERLSVHLHDTFGRAVHCVVEALRCGVRSFDGAVAGLGGCPYAGTPERPAPGNVSTERVVEAVRGAAFQSGVDAARLSEAAAFATTLVARTGGAGR